MYPSTPDPRPPRCRFPVPAAWWIGSLTLPLAAAAAPPSFQREIRPLLSEHCFRCHGPDAGSRAPKSAPLRLDLPEAATAKRADGSFAIRPGEPAASAVLARVKSSDPDEVMPPPKTHKALTAAQVAALEQWIAAGARYETHWAFQPLPAAVPVPPTAPAERFEVRSPLDAFILHRLQQEKIEPSPPAAREAWLRRATLDLTGLPPTRAELDAFLADTSPGAFETAVDRLFASPRFGERWAMHWMEVARYADSFGYQSDLDTNAWPWRDWLIKAFNENLPFDQFLTWQLAGDLLPEATREQRLATAFNRIHRKTQEGGSIEAEFRQEGVNDRVHTFGTAFLGLTLECARCHDHKYDPATMKDYYSLGAFFNSIDEWGLLHGAGGINPRPVLLLPTTQQEQDLAAKRAAVAAAEQALADTAAAREPEFLAWLAARPAAPAWSDRSGAYALDQADGDRLANSARPDKPGTFAAANRLVEGRSGKAVAFSGDDSIRFDKGTAAHQHDPLSVAFWLKAPAAAPRMVVFHSTDGWDPGYNGYELLLESGHLRWTWQREWPGDCISVRTKDRVPQGEWAHVVVSYDGSSKAAGLKIFLGGKPAALEVVRDKLVKNCGSFDAIHFGARRRDSGMRDGVVDEVATFDRALSAAEAAELADGRSLTELLGRPPEQLDEGARGALRDYWRSAVDSGTRTAAAELREARVALRAALDGVAEIPVMEEQPQPRPAFVLARGAYDAPQTESAPRAVPSWLPPLPEGAPVNRLGLARWLLRPDHPLTARVTVNRFWQEIFGKGLVDTSDNFGLQGTPPSHPELLDWLARDFIDHGWDFKRLLRGLVLSSTYRQASTSRLDLLDRDRGNRLLARGPAKRLTAEMLRDSALQLGGLLRPETGGPPVKPYQPDGSMWRALNSFLPEYRADTGAGLHRRSLYTFWRRTTTPPNMMAFDTASRDVCSVRRQPTNTPLQPLVTLNDPQFVEAARGLASRMLKAAGDPPAQLAGAFRETTGREPTPRELELLASLHAEQLEFFRADPAAAAVFLKTGATPPDPALEPCELAAAAVTASALLNLDAFLTAR
jgi:mono/diheme cytochrome c family protein